MELTSIKELKSQLISYLDEANLILNNISDDDYKNLTSGSFENMDTFGKHMRHILNLFDCLFDGYEGEFINYEKRDRDLTLETKKDSAKKKIREINNKINKYHLNKEVKVKSDLGVTNSSFSREIEYVTSHAVHHFAILRIMMDRKGITYPENFGFAISTLKNVHSN